jgi:hypothetical protein
MCGFSTSSIGQGKGSRRWHASCDLASSKESIAMQSQGPSASPTPTAGTASGQATVVGVSAAGAAIAAAFAGVAGGPAGVAAAAATAGAAVAGESAVDRALSSPDVDLDNVKDTVERDPNLWRKQGETFHEWARRLGLFQLVDDVHEQRKFQMREAYTGRVLTRGRAEREAHVEDVEHMLRETADRSGVDLARVKRAHEIFEEMPTRAGSRARAMVDMIHAADGGSPMKR